MCTLGYMVVNEALGIFVKMVFTRNNYVFCVVVMVTTVLVLRVNCKIPQADSFDESFEDSSSVVSPELKKALIPAEDAFLDFVNRLVNTGYASSKITLNRIEKESKKRRQFRDQLEQFLSKLPNYQSEIPVVDQMPRALENPHGLPQH